MRLSLRVARLVRSLSMFGPFLLSMYLMFEWGYSPQEVGRLRAYTATDKTLLLITLQCLDES